MLMCCDYCVLTGRKYPLEAHLVSVVPQSAVPSCPLEGCILVTAVLYELDDGDLQANNTWLEPLFNIMPYRWAGQVTGIHENAVLSACRTCCA
jgi:hypothetical protein